MTLWDKRACRRAFCLGITLGMIAGMFGVSQVAQAQSCISTDKQLQSTEVANQDLHIGVRTNLNFASANSDCSRISAVGVINVNETGLVEWGWILGYSAPACGGNYYSSPTLFLAWQNPGQQYRCRIAFGNTSGYYTVEASDLNQNTWWNVYKAGSQVDKVDMDFHRGNIFLLTERHNPNDSGYGDFQSLKKALTSTSSFNSFTNPGVLADLDDAYKFCKVSDTQVKHIANGATC